MLVEEGPDVGAGDIQGAGSGEAGADVDADLSMSRPARMRESASMAGMAAAPPMEWPAIAIRDGSISPAPGHGGCAPVSSPSTNETSAARPATNFSPNPVSLRRVSRARQVATRPSGKAVA
jgi:hypothetical protein